MLNETKHNGYVLTCYYQGASYRSKNHKSFIHQESAGKASLTSHFHRFANVFF